MNTTLEFHPSAANAFDSKAYELVFRVVEAPRQHEARRVNPDIEPDATLTADDLAGELDERIVNHERRTVSRFFHVGEKRFGLVDDAYQSLADLAERIALSNGVRDVLGRTFVEDQLFGYVRSSFREGPPDRFCRTLGRAAADAVIEQTLLIPIAALYVEEAFGLGKVTIAPLSRAKVESWEKQLPANAAPLVDQIRKRMQGRAVAAIQLRAEPGHAVAVALEEAQLATSYLAIYSAGARLPEVSCLSKILGMEHIPRTTAIVECDGRMSQLHESIAATSAEMQWVLSKATVARLQEFGLRTLHRLLAAEKRSSFEDQVLNAVLIYSKVAYSSEPVEKVVYVLSALESILLKNETEPIQQNLAERIAFFIGSDLAQRRNIVADVRSAYSIRSRYLHHGHKRSELDAIEKFLGTAWIFFVNLIDQASRFATKEEFIAAIEDRKLS